MTPQTRTVTRRAVSPHQRTKASTDISALSSAERILSLTLVCVFALLCGTFFLHAGALWRDEANSVSLTSEASLSTIVRHLDADSFPLLWLLLLREWIQTCHAHSDFAIRLLGLLTALCVPAALIWNARLHRLTFPYWSFLLLGLNPVFIRCIGSTRAYGLGVVLVLCTSAAMLHVSRGLTLRRTIAAFVLALLCVQCVYYNILFVGAMCLAGILVAHRRGDRKAIGFFVLVCVAGAASLLPYLPTLAHQHDWSALIARPVSSLDLGRVLLQALGAGGGVFVLIWAALVVFALKTSLTQEISDSTLYARTVLCVSPPVYYLFLKVLQYQTSPWYYAEIMALAVLQIDTLLADNRVPAWRLARLCVIGLVLVPAFNIARSGAQMRQTGIDLAAALVQQHARPGDLVLVNPWYYGASFARYYPSRAAWDTIPSFAFHKYGGMDQMKRRMAQAQPITQTLSQISSALRGGHTVWLVGDLPFILKGEQVRSLPPAPGAPAGWHSAAYSDNWGRQAQSLLVEHAKTIRIHEVVSDQPINALECPQVEECAGWSGPGLK